MGEALLTRAGGSSSSSGGGANGNFHTEILYYNETWRVPHNLKNNEVTVRIFGGGGNGSIDAGGNGGGMNYGTINVQGHNYIPVSIGGPGATSSFGTFLSANGARGSGGGVYGSTRFNGGYFAYSHPGCSGEYGGGGGSITFAYIQANANDNVAVQNAGQSKGGQYGGGGGGGIYNGSIVNSGCGNGGYIKIYTNNKSFSNIAAKNGVNTIGFGLEFEGEGKAGISNNGNAGTTGGGGGYGGNGGNGIFIYNELSGGNFPVTYAYAGGGGGGYGADGGDASGGRGQYHNIHWNGAYLLSGAGGGYGGKGGNSYSTIKYDKGKFYNDVAAIIGGGGGYGIYGNGGEYDETNGYINNAGIAAGGHGVVGSNECKLAEPGIGGRGICIIQYYTE